MDSKNPEYRTRSTDDTDGCFECAVLTRRFEDHLVAYNQHRKEEVQRWDNFIAVQRENTESINKLAESTQGMVEAWTAGSGAIKVITWGGKAVKWISGVGAAGAALWASFHFIPK